MPKAHFEKSPLAEVIFGVEFNAQNFSAVHFGLYWQEGRKQEVIDYCLNDVKLLKQLYFRFINGLLKDPHSGKLLGLTQNK